MFYGTLFSTLFIFGTLYNVLSNFGSRARMHILNKKICDINLYMPRKRRKAIASIVTPDIPYPKVRVEWIDCVSDSGWATEKEFDRMKLAKPVNEGWLYSKDKHSIKLFASYDKDEDGLSFGDRTMIPRAWVKKIQKL